MNDIHNAASHAVETGKSGTTKQCCHIYRASLHPSIKIGGASLGRCEHEALPGMTVCWKHAEREAMAFWIDTLAKRVLALGGEIE